ncbi:MAG TPA: sugar transferase [Candidatus Acidoferrales bacterium]|nr:sugar transferase [Candidatus Acidoferrales bacterium]
MIRIFNAYFPTRTLLLVFTETVVAFCALIGATYVLYGGDSTILLFYENGVLRIGIVCAICVLCIYYYDLYNSLVISSTREVVTKLVQVVGTTCIILAVLYYLYPAIQIRTGLFVPAVLFMGICLIGWRRVFAIVNRSQRLAERAIILGDGPLVLPLSKEIENRPELGFRVVGFVGDPNVSMNGLSRLGAIDEIGEVAAERKIERIIVTMGERRGKLPVEKLLNMKMKGVMIEDGNAFYETLTGKVALESLRPSQLLFSTGFFASRGMLITKRLLSVALSLVALVITAPVMLVVALAILIDSGRPVLFRQKRVGKDGRIFTLYKFRSMKIEGNVNAAGNGKAQPAKSNDERFTRTGRMIRRLRVDELPQLYNILKGDMYFVGPRPFMLEEEEQLSLQIPFYKQRWAVKPGVTGWAQINRPYCVTLEDNLEKLSYDLFYVKNMSVGLDMLILFQTAKTLLLRRGSR